MRLVSYVRKASSKVVEIKQYSITDKWNGSNRSLLICISEIRKNYFFRQERSILQKPSKIITKVLKFSIKKIEIGTFAKYLISDDFVIEWNAILLTFRRDLVHLPYSTTNHDERDSNSNVFLLHGIYPLCCCAWEQYH